MHLFWINDNTRMRGDKEVEGSIIKHGRVHLDYGKVKRESEKGSWTDWKHRFRASWKLGDFSCGIGLSIETTEGNEATFHLALPWLFSIWLTHSVPRWLIRVLLPVQSEGEGYTLYNDREIRVTVHHGALWWHLWMHPMGGLDGYGGKRPRWRDGNFDPLDFLFGTYKSETETLIEPFDVSVPMPEGVYPAKLKQEEHRVKRRRWPRWPFNRTWVSWDFEIDCGIPYYGKGENSWDCGDDGTFGLHFSVKQARTAPEAIGYLVGTVLRSRDRYGPKSLKWRCSAEEHIAEVEARRRKAQDARDEQAANAVKSS